MTGTKVEAIHHHGVRALENFVVGRVLAVERHPDADRLQRLRGRSRRGAAEGPATIVCGAAERRRRADGGGGAARRGDARRHAS